MCSQCCRRCKKRVSTNPVDKVTGLAYLFWSVREIPAYYETQSLEDVWTALVGVMLGLHRANLFFLYPDPGDGNKIWRPSWRQVMAEVLPSDSLHGWVSVRQTEETDADWYAGPCIEAGYVHGLAEGSLKGKHRQGELVVEHHSGAKHTFRIVANHQYPIPEGLYTLLGNKPFDDNEVKVQDWVVGRRLPDQMFKKVSVFEIPDLEEVRRLHGLKVAKQRKISLS